MRKNNFDKIPKDWEVKCLADVTDIKVGKDLMQDSFSEIKTNEHKYPVYSNSHVNYGLYGYYNFKEYTGNSVTVVGRGDVGKAFKRSGSFGAIGRLIVLFPNEKLDNNYLSECINFHVSFHQESSAVPQLTGKQIGTYSIPLPPLPEQQKIAEILSTVDAKIEVIDQQITETQALKKGLMQRLLTKGIGHTEFKDSALGKIPKSWEVLILGDIANFSQGIQIGTEQHISELKDGYQRFIRIIDYTQPNNNDIRYVPNQGERYYANAKDIVMIRYGTPGIIGRGIEGIIANNMFKITFNHLVIDDFAEHFFKYSATIKKINDGSASSTMPAINFGFLKKLSFLVPPIPEQQKIAEILYSVDAKIEVLLEKKTHYQELKQGLMQQLLTGKIRVKI